MTRHTDPLSPGDLIAKAMSKVGRDQMGGVRLGKTALLRHAVLARALLAEVRDRYTTLPQGLRAALEDFIRE